MSPLTKAVLWVIVGNIAAGATVGLLATQGVTTVTAHPIVAGTVIQLAFTVAALKLSGVV